MWFMTRSECARTWPAARVGAAAVTSRGPVRRAAGRARTLDGTRAFAPCRRGQRHHGSGAATMAIALAATIPVPTIPVALAASDEAGGDRKALDQLLDDAMRLAPSRPKPDGQPSGPPGRPPTPAVRWTRACDVDGYDGMITGGDIVVYFLGAADKPDAISVDQGRTRRFVLGT